jgi:hypothetical protein
MSEEEYGRELRRVLAEEYGRDPWVRLAALEWLEARNPDLVARWRERRTAEEWSGESPRTAP